jgi:hypothetical protein
LPAQRFVVFICQIGRPFVRGKHVVKDAMLLKIAQQEKATPPSKNPAK